MIQVDPAEFGATLEDVRLHLESSNIEAPPVWKPMHLQRVFEGCRVVGGSVAADLFDRDLCLPSGSQTPNTLASALLAAYVLYFDFVLPADRVREALIQLPLPMVLLVQGTMLRALGAYSFVWRYVGMTETATFVRAFGFSAAVLLGLRLGLPDWLGPLKVPISIVLMDAVLAFGGVLGMRVVWRGFVEKGDRRRREHGKGNGHRRGAADRRRSRRRDGGAGDPGSW